MNAKEAIGARRSIRKYEERPIPIELIRELLDAARLAPSGCNAQPWRFYLVHEKQTLGELREKNAFQQGFVSRAPLIIVCCGDPRVYLEQHGGDYQVAEGSVPQDPAARMQMFSIVEGQEDMRAIRDVSIASGFLVLRATELGLGTCFIGLIDQAVLKEVLGIPGDYVIPFVITVGFHTANPSARPRNDLAQMIIGDSLPG